MRNELMRRISDALDSDEGLAGDPELSKLLSSDKVAGRYARDLARMNRWFATWPAGAPIDEQMAALTTRIEQRLSEPLVRHDDVTAAPEFDDDDALAEATAALTKPGTSKAKSVFRPAETPESASAVVVPAPPGARVRSPRLSVAKLAIAKAPALGGLHEETVRKPDPRVDSVPPQASASSDAASSDAASSDAASSETPVLAVPIIGGQDAPLSDPGIVLSSPGIEITPEELARAEAAMKAAPVLSAAPPPPPGAAPRPLRSELASANEAPTSLRPKKKNSKRPLAEGAEKKSKRDSGDRFSIPMPEPVALNPPRFGEAAPAPTKSTEKGSGYGLWAGLAAAAVIFLAVAVSMRAGVDEPAPTTAIARAPSASGAAEPTATAVAAILPAAAPTAAAPIPIEAADLEAPMAAALVPADPVGMLGAEAAPEAPRRGSAGVARVDEPADALTGSDGRAARTRASTGAGTAAADDSTGPAGRGADTTARPGPAATTVPVPPPVATPTPPPLTPTPEGAAPPGRTHATVPDEPAGDLPPHPDRDGVQAALSSVADAVAACAEGEHGTASVYVVVVSSGRVTTATVSGRFAGTPAGSCIARAVRHARFPAFAEDRFEVTYPYSF